jgi:hypothetical protein
MNVGDLRKWIEEQVRDYCDDQDIVITPERFEDTVRGVQYDIEEKIREKISDAMI